MKYDVDYQKDLVENNKDMKDQMIAFAELNKNNKGTKKLKLDFKYEKGE